MVHLEGAQLINGAIHLDPLAAYIIEATTPAARPTVAP
jgi:hypothetical protein